MKLVTILAIAFLASCAVSPETAKKKAIESAFLHYKNKAISWSPKVEVLAYETANDHNSADNPPFGYQHTEYFVAYDPDPYCVNWYSVYEKCENSVCEFEFKINGGFCE